MDVDASERSADGGGRGRDAPRRSCAAGTEAVLMSKPPQLRIIQGSKEADERRLYRLRQGHETASATAVLEWPRAGAWRELVHRLLRNPVLPQ